MNPELKNHQLQTGKNGSYISAHISLLHWFTSGTLTGLHVTETMQPAALWKYIDD